LDGWQVASPSDNVIFPDSLSSKMTSFLFASGVKTCFHWRIYRDNVRNNSTRQRHTFNYPGHLGQSDRDRNDPICVASPKASKMSVAVANIFAKKTSPMYTSLNKPNSAASVTKAKSLIRLRPARCACCRRRRWPSSRPWSPCPSPWRGV
jgi:hypothetical protein